jgi:hypothetical protein
MVVASVLLVAACGGAIAAVHFAVGATDASTEGWQWRMAGAIAVDVLLLAATAAAIAFLVRRLNGMTARALVASVQAADPAAGLIRADMLEAGPPREGWDRARTSRWLDEVTDLAGGLDMIVYEQVRRHAGTDASHAYGGWLAILSAWCEQKSIAYEGVPVGTIKRYATGKGNADKAAMIAAMRARGFAPTDDNEADALALLLWATDAEGGRA